MCKRKNRRHLRKNAVLIEVGGKKEQVGQRQETKTLALERFALKHKNTLFFSLRSFKTFRGGGVREKPVFAEVFL